ALPVVLGIASEIAGAEALQGYVALLGLFEAITFFFLPALLPEGALGGERRGAVRADRTGVFFRNKQILRRDDVRGVWIEPKRGGTRLVHLAARRARGGGAMEVADDAGGTGLRCSLYAGSDR